MHTFKNQNPLIIGVIALMVGVAVGYFVPHAGTTSRGSFAQNGTLTRGSAMIFPHGAASASFLSGTIAEVGNGSLTLNTRDGSSHVVLLTSDTAVSKSVAGSTSDLTVGEDVLVSGTTGSDGSVSANNVQLRPTPAPSANASMQPAPRPQ